MFIFRINTAKIYLLVVSFSSKLKCNLLLHNKIKDLKPSNLFPSVPNLSVLTNQFLGQRRMYFVKVLFMYLRNWKKKTLIEYFIKQNMLKQVYVSFVLEFVHIFSKINEGKWTSVVCLPHQQSVWWWRRCLTCEVSGSEHCWSVAGKVFGPSFDPFPLAPATESRWYNNCNGEINFLLRLKNGLQCKLTGLV